MNMPEGKQQKKYFSSDSVGD